eukprot:TRINITY_DN2322_c0_g4_i1.p1 TRINITY_DN2322_c0_g4~~TRINITY_DN2322_c0_g4_i1.p1  ORF type:complete len:289 (-),score=15.67 TRINITY_DN2322_c0_g4_i1:130-996(-)
MCWFSSCCAKSSKNSVIQNRKPEPSRLVIPPPPHKNPPLMQVNVENKVAVAQNEPLKNSPSYKLLTNVDKSNIRFSEERPEISKRKQFPYYCPLCFRYFNSMLTCFRCKNYICRFCADDIGDKNSEAVRCPFCDCSPFVLLDVNEKDPIKKYSDTSYLTAVSAFRFTKKPGIAIRNQSAAQKENGGAGENSENGAEEAGTPNFKGAQAKMHSKQRRQRRLGSYLEEIKENGNLPDWSPIYDASRMEASQRRPLRDYNMKTAPEIDKDSSQTWNMYEDIDDSEVSIASI